MKIEQGLNPNCSEAVFRFYTLEPKKIQTILQAIANEISATEGDNIPAWKNQKVPLFKTAEEYDSKWNKKGKASYSGGTYGKTLLKACAGLGDNEAVVTIEKDKGAFVLNIGNNSISEDKTGWVEKIQDIGIKVIEAEGGNKESDELREKYARDCCCGVTFGFERRNNCGS